MNIVFINSKIKVSSYGKYIVLLFISNAYPILAKSVGESCNTNSDCDYMNFCNAENHICNHNSILPINIEIVFGLLSICIGSALSNAGGIGGGGLLIPILLLILKFYTHEAIPLSKLMIFTGAVTAFILGFRQKHPSRDAISVDYNIPTLMVPLLLFGTMVGVSLNKVMPPWIILFSLTFVLFINTYKTIKKAILLYKQEMAYEMKTFSDDPNEKDNNTLSYFIPY